MPPASSPRPTSYSPRLVIALVLIAGVIGSGALYRFTQSRVERKRSQDLDRLVESRHALIRETLDGYQEGVFALKLLLAQNAALPRAEFARAAAALLARHPGVLALQWAPLVTAAQRADWERAGAEDFGPGFQIIQRQRDGTDVRASPRPEYFPIRFAEPLESNRPVLGSDATLVRLALPADSPFDPQLRSIEIASLRAADLCQQMLAYAGMGRLKLEPVDLSALVETLRPLIEVALVRRATLHLVLKPELPAVLVDPALIRQSVMNLILNAAESIGEPGGEITLSTGVMHADHALLATCAAGNELIEGDYVFIEVRDTGSGMTPEIIAKIFDPFFTTKFTGRGLGLSAAIGTVRGHKGALRVVSSPGHGSVFRLLLPPVPGGAPLPPQTEPPPSTGWQRTGRGLIIDDDELVRSVNALMIRSFGLEPFIALDGAAGLAAFRENPASFDLVLLDLLMPGLSGEETLIALRALRPDVRVLIVSGHSADDIMQRQAGGSGPLAFLHKPFKRTALEQKLRELLG
ncbi:MAG: response regulator [Opitutus sp.]|nr:response regulator [Opitutus sp.]